METKVKLPLLSVSRAQELNSKLMKVGIPTTDRVMVAISNAANESTTASGLIIPGGNKEGVPRKGTIVQRGPISDEYLYLKDLLEIGDVVTYGNYAGKEVEPEGITVNGFSLTVLSIAEICYIERQSK